MRSIDCQFIIKCIESCKNEFQIKCCFKLVEFYKIKYDEADDMLNTMLEALLKKQDSIAVAF